MSKPFGVETETVFVGIFGKRTSSKYTHFFDNKPQAEDFASQWKTLTAPNCSEAHTRIVNNDF